MQSDSGNTAAPISHTASHNASQPDITGYRTEIVSDLAGIDPAAWDALLSRQPEATPFLRHAFLHALHASGSACAETGWHPRYLTLWAGKRLAAAMPLYAKAHSYGEYVFDWAWADAYVRHGIEYYPKWLSAIPFTPVRGARLIAEDEQTRRLLLEVALALAAESKMSSLHILFPDDAEADLMQEAGMLMRHGVQFHWTNGGEGTEPGGERYASFDDFLATLSQKKRKNIRAERRQVAQAGITFRHLRGSEIDDDAWRFFNRCYRQTYREHHSTPYLNLDFFRRIGAAMPQHLLLVVAEREGQRIASSLLVYDDAPEVSTLYGRYWGALEYHPCLHFETAYYQPLEFCIAQGIRTFEGGAQGEHKMARGFLPVATRSAHWLAHADFADAVERFLVRERQGIDAYLDELGERNPFARS